MSEGDILALGEFPLGQFILLSFLVCGALNSCVLLSEIPQAAESLRVITSIGILVTFMLAFGTLFLVSPCSLLFLLFQKTRGLGLRLLLICIIYFLTLTTLGIAGSTIRSASFQALAERSMPLVGAVQAFEKSEGHPPKRLQDLVPKYLDSVPSTGMAAYPHYEIHVGDEASMWEGNPWVLCVSSSRSILNWDLFLYFPNQNYPPDESSAFERMGAWAYWHE